MVWRELYSNVLTRTFFSFSHKIRDLHGGGSVSVSGVGLVSFGCGRATKCGRVAVDLKVGWGWEWSDETAKWEKRRLAPVKGKQRRLGDKGDKLR